MAGYNVQELLVERGQSIHAHARQLINQWVVRKTTENGGSRPSIENICAAFDRSPSFIRSIVCDGKLEPAAHGGGMPARFDAAVLGHFYSHALEFPLETLQQYQGWLCLNVPGILKYPDGRSREPPGVSMLHTYLKKGGLSRQARRALSSLRHRAEVELYAPEFLLQAAAYGDAVAFFDATGVNRNTGVINKGWARVGAGGCRAAAGNFYSGDNLTVFSFMDRDGIFMPRVFEGPTTMERVLEYFTDSVGEAARRGVKCIILDNAKQHARGWLMAICAFWGVDILFLPPYYPDWNPIEKAWALMKVYLGENRAALPGAPVRTIMAALAKVTAQNARNWIRESEAYPMCG